MIKTPQLWPQQQQQPRTPHTLRGTPRRTVEDLGKTIGRYNYKWGFSLTCPVADMKGVSKQLLHISVVRQPAQGSGDHILLQLW